METAPKWVHSSKEIESKKENLLVKEETSTELIAQEKELNQKILKITMLIREHCPELSKFIEEMNETIPSQKKPEVTLENLKTYYESLQKMVDKYIIEHPSNERCFKEGLPEKE